MKKCLLFIAAFSFIILKSVAQPTLTAATITPKVGESFTGQYAKATNVGIMNGGANQTWDYSGLQDSAGGYRFTAVNPSSTPYADSFRTSNLALRTLNDSAFVYFNSQSNSLRELGSASDTIGILRYNPSKIYLPYPFSYNNFFTDSVGYVISTNTGGPLNLALTFAGRDSLYGDGYGTLKIPGKTFSNVLRVKYIENLNFSYSIDTLGLTITLHGNIRTIDYIYFTPDTHAPLMDFTQTFSSSYATAFGVVVPGIGDTTESNQIAYLRNFILPVTFASFNASLNNKEVNLKWQTGQEINSNTFNVQRSLTGTVYNDIAQIKANGSATGSIYNYNDLDFVKSDVPPTVYYRIKEIDKDGKEFYSTTAIVRGNTGLVRLYPNPAKDYINFSIKDATVADAISIYDAKGHLVQQYQNYQINKPVNISNYSKGTYFIQLKIKDKTTTTTVVKE